MVSTWWSLTTGMNGSFLCHVPPKICRAWYSVAKIHARPSKVWKMYFFDFKHGSFGLWGQVESSKCVRVTRKVPHMCFESVTCFACFFLDAWFKTSGPRQIVTRAVANLGGAWVVHDTRVLFVVRTGGRAERTVRRGHCQPV